MTLRPDQAAAGSGMGVGRRAAGRTPMRLLVPYAAGGGTDAIARLVANGVGEKLGQTMVVENNGAAGGNLATQQAAGAAPDGYTVLMANQGPMVVNPHLFKNVKVDPQRFKHRGPPRKRSAPPAPPRREEVRQESLF